LNFAPITCRAAATEERIGREGVRFAMEDMTNIQMVAIRLDG